MRWWFVISVDGLSNSVDVEASLTRFSFVCSAAMGSKSNVKNSHWNCSLFCCRLQIFSRFKFVSSCNVINMQQLKTTKFYCWGKNKTFFSLATIINSILIAKLFWIAFKRVRVELNLSVTEGNLIVVFKVFPGFCWKLKRKNF